MASNNRNQSSLRHLASPLRVVSAGSYAYEAWLVSAPQGIAWAAPGRLTWMLLPSHEPLDVVSEAQTTEILRVANASRRIVVPLATNEAWLEADSGIRRSTPRRAGRWGRSSAPSADRRHLPNKREPPRVPTAAIAKG